MTTPAGGPLVGLGAPYALAGLMFAGFAILNAREAAHEGRTALRAASRATCRAGFGALLALSFLAGDRLGDVANGGLVVALGVCAALGRPGMSARAPAIATTTAPERAASAARHGDRLILLALVTPAVAIVGSLALKPLRLGERPLVDGQQAAVISLALGVVAALAAAFAVLRPRPLVPLQEGRRLGDLVGWALVLPQALAALGAVFAFSGVGGAVGTLVDRFAPLDTPALAVVGFTVGMALLTAMIGNAFAAFPVMTAAIGLPLIVRRFHGDPAIMGALGMLSGFCGTLVTPLAANFNLVPVALLELPDRWAVIRVQAPTAAAMLAVNTALMWALVYRF